jgi:lipopolysaccharide export system protein LptA
VTRLFRACAVVVALAVPGSATAEATHPASPGPIQGVFQGQSQNQDQPIQIEAATLEVRDKSKTAIFSGNVVVVQGDTTMKCKSLVVFYGPEEGSGAAKPVATAAPPAAGPPKGAQDIRRIEAHGGVTVTTKDHNASGDLGVYDLKAKTITLTGNVVVSQGKNVLRGERVVVDTTTGNARVESGATTQNRVRALILPSKHENGSPSNVMSFGPSRAN